jgi:F420-dependent oxidoreductase-like protein
MRLRIHVEPTEVGAGYDVLSRAARAAEEFGFDGFFRSDHYLRFGARGGSAGPSDAWTSLAGLARDTTRIRLGTLVSPVTFRSPGQLAIQVAQVDQMSAGRVELGLGTGWFEAEHTAYGIPFPDQRFARLVEQLEIVTGLWTSAPGTRFSYDGRHYRVHEADPPLPTVQHPHPPVVIGGMGDRRSPALAARYADEYNALAASPAAAGTRFERVRRHAADLGRADGVIAFSVLQTLCCGATDAEVRRRAEALGEDLGPDAFAGTPDAVVDRLGRYAEAGATRAYLRVLDLDDLDQLELVAAKVLPQLS